jgi:diguanylate cyclase (GGDEF)-like protein
MQGVSLLADAARRPLGFVGQFVDITATKDAEAALMHLALYDQLTGLPNRTMIDDRLNQAVSQYGVPGQEVMVLLIDLDRFKVVNDYLGHSAGDIVLVAVAGRLRGLLRDGDTIGRFGGDEFVLVCPHPAGVHDPAGHAGRRHDPLRRRCSPARRAWAAMASVIASEATTSTLSDPVISVTRLGQAQGGGVEQACTEAAAWPSALICAASRRWDHGLARSSQVGAPRGGARARPGTNPQVPGVTRPLVINRPDGYDERVDRRHGQRARARLAVVAGADLDVDDGRVRRHFDDVGAVGQVRGGEPCVSAGNEPGEVCAVAVPVQIARVGGLGLEGEIGAVDDLAGTVNGASRLPATGYRRRR